MIQYIKKWWDERYPTKEETIVSDWIESIKVGDKFQATYIDRMDVSGKRGIYPEYDETNHAVPGATHVDTFVVDRKYRGYMQVHPRLSPNEICYVNYLDLWDDGIKTYIYAKRK